MFGHIKRELCDLEFNFKGGDKKKKLAFHVLIRRPWAKLDLHFFSPLKPIRMPYLDIYYKKYCNRIDFIIEIGCREKP